MSDIDDLAFACALRRKPIGTEAKQLIASLPNEAVGLLSRVVAEHVLEETPPQRIGKSPSTRG